jgi:hypothetical protein
MPPLNFKVNIVLTLIFALSNVPVYYFDKIFVMVPSVHKQYPEVHGLFEAR